MPGRCPARAAADVCKSYILCKIPQNRLHFLQPQRPAAAYVPAAVHTAAPEAPTLIDINTATVEELTALPGLGPRKAAALVAYREAHGPFATLADAAAVKGISLRMTESWAGLAAANH